MQKDDFQYIWDNKCQIEVVQLSVGFVKNLWTQRYKTFGPLPPPRGFPWFCT